jgi:hypothetical protein
MKKIPCTVLKSIFRFRPEHLCGERIFDSPSTTSSAHGRYSVPNVRRWIFRSTGALPCTDKEILCNDA